MAQRQNMLRSQVKPALQAEPVAPAERQSRPLQYAIKESTDKLRRTHTKLSEFMDRFKDGYHDDISRYAVFRELIPDRVPLIGGSSYGAATFRKNVYKIDVMPTNFLTWIYHEFRQLKGDDAKQVYNFIRDNADLINECRRLYMDMYTAKRKITPETVRETTQRELLAIAHVDRPKLLSRSEFRHEVSLRLIQYPQIMSWQEMYQFYTRNTRHQIVTLDTAENYTDYVHNDASTQATDNGDKYAFNIDNLRKRYSDNSPWKTANKLEHHAKRYKWSPTKLDTVKSTTMPDSFDWKAQRSLMKHYVGGRYTFIIDYFFAGDFRYLLAVNMNTRKAYFAIPDEIYRIGHNWNKPPRGEWNVNAQSVIHSIEHIMTQTNIREILMDNESAFNSEEFRRFLKKNNINYRYVVKYNVGNNIDTEEPSRSTHSTSIIDRLCGTIRRMNYNLGNGRQINPPMMNYLIDEYNSSIHATLSKILGRYVTPNQVDSDINLETELARRIHIQNFITEHDNDYAVEDTVRVYNNANPMDKVKPKLLPGKWKYVGRENGLFKLRQNDAEIMVPRWMIKNEAVWGDFKLSEIDATRSKI